MKLWLICSIGAMFCWGIWAFLPKISVQYMKPESAMVWEILGSFVVVCGILLVHQNIETDIRGIIPSFFTGLLGFFGVFLFLYAVKDGKVSVVATLTAIYPIITLILAYFILGEKLTFKQYIGVALALASVALLSWE